MGRSLLIINGGRKCWFCWFSMCIFPSSIFQTVPGKLCELKQLYSFIFKFKSWDKSGWKWLGWVECPSYLLKSNEALGCTLLCEDMSVEEAWLGWYAKDLKAYLCKHCPFYRVYSTEGLFTAIGRGMSQPSSLSRGGEIPKCELVSLALWQLYIKSSGLKMKKNF